MIGMWKLPLCPWIPLFAWSADLRDYMGSAVDSPGWSVIFNVIWKPLEPVVFLVKCCLAESAAYFVLWILLLTCLNSKSERANTTLMFSFFLVFRSFSIKLAPRIRFYAVFFFGVYPSYGLIC